MKKRKNHVKRFAAVASSMIVLFLMVAPLSVSAAGYSVESYNAHSYWNSWVPSFSPTDSITLKWYDMLDFSLGNLFNRPFDRYIPKSLRDDLYEKGYYSDIGIALAGQDLDADFSISYSFSIQLKKPMYLNSGDRIQFYYIPVEMRFINDSTGLPVYFDNPQNCYMSYVDNNGHEVVPQGLNATFAKALTDDNYYMAKVLIENVSLSQIEVNTLKFTFQTQSNATYSGAAYISMILSNVVRINVDPDLYPDVGEIENIVGSIDDAVNEWNEKLDDYFGGNYDVDIPDYSLIVGDGNEVIEDLEGNGLANFGSLMNDFASGAMQTDVVYGNMIVQNALFWIYANPFPSFMMAMCCALLCTRALFGR